MLIFECPKFLTRSPIHTFLVAFHLARKRIKLTYYNKFKRLLMIACISEGSQTLAPQGSYRELKKKTE